MSEVIVQRLRTKYHWPALQLNFWLLIMLVGSSLILGVFASFMTIQQQLQVGVPWLVHPLIIDWVGVVGEMKEA